MRYGYSFLIIGILFLVFSCVNDDESDLSSSSQLSSVSKEALSPQAKAFLAQSGAWLQGQDSSVQKGIERLGSLDWKCVAYSPVTENSPEMLSVALNSEGQGQRFVTFTAEKGGIRSDLYAVEPRENGMASRSFQDFSGDVYKFDARGRFESGYRLRVVIPICCFEL